MLVRKAEATRERLVFIFQGLKSLLADDDLMALLQIEGLDTLPKNLALRMQGN
jgi:ParB family transcriptional regulator, chromosome partitioning protein